MSKLPMEVTSLRVIFVLRLLVGDEASAFVFVFPAQQPRNAVPIHLGPVTLVLVVPMHMSMFVAVVDGPLNVVFDMCV